MSTASATVAGGAIELREWRQCFLPDRHLSSSARILADELRGAEGGRLIVDDLHDGLRITTRAWVGVVRLDDLGH